MRLLISLPLAVLMTQCQPKQPAKPDPAPAVGTSASVNSQSVVVNNTTDDTLKAKTAAYNQLADGASKAAAAASAAKDATVQNPQQNQNTAAAVNELSVVLASLPPPKAEDLLASNERLRKALSTVVKDREDVQKQYDQLVGEAKGRQQALDALNKQAADLTAKLGEERAKFDTQLQTLNRQITELSTAAAASRAEEARARREIATMTRQKMALGAGGLSALLFVLALVGLAMKFDLAAVVAAFVGSIIAAAAGVAISTIEDIITQTWFAPAATVTGIVLLAIGGWFGWATYRKRVLHSLTDLQATTTTGAIQEMRNDAQTMMAKLANMNLAPEAKAAVEAELKKGQDAWQHLSGYLDEWHRDPNTGQPNQALKDKIGQDAVKLNLTTTDFTPNVTAKSV